MQEIRTGLGFDAHRFAEGRDLVLGGVRIDHARGLLGHSDADVLCHAVADAVLGAAAAGDIGVHFPDSDERWRGADSLDLLSRSTAMVGDMGWRVGNVDVTVMAEAPRLRPHVDAMCRRLAGALGCGVDAVSVKATTVEGMGALGREEGIAACAVATLVRDAGDRGDERTSP